MKFTFASVLQQRYLSVLHLDKDQVNDNKCKLPLEMWVFTSNHKSIGTRYIMFFKRLLL